MSALATLVISINDSEMQNGSGASDRMTVKEVRTCSPNGESISNTKPAARILVAGDRESGDEIAAETGRKTLATFIHAPETHVADLRQTGRQPNVTRHTLRQLPPWALSAYCNLIISRGVIITKPFFVDGANLRAIRACEHRTPNSGRAARRHSVERNNLYQYKILLFC